MSHVFIQPFAPDEFDSFLAYARAHETNLEIATFARPDLPDGQWDNLLAAYLKKLQGFHGMVSMHGLFQDMVLHSRDRHVANTVKARIRRCLETAQSLGAKYIVFHSNYNPMIRHEFYVRNWAERQAEFWNGILGNLELAVLIENLWEPSPDVLRHLLARIDFPNFKICFDTGHAHVYSEAPIESWFAALRGDIAYIHVNDNRGDLDAELVPGSGSIDWATFSKLVLQLDTPPEIVFEVGSLDNTERAISYFRKHRLYPFD